MGTFLIDTERAILTGKRTTCKNLHSTGDSEIVRFHKLARCENEAFVIRSHTSLFCGIIAFILV